MTTDIDAVIQGDSVQTRELLSVLRRACGGAGIALGPRGDPSRVASVASKAEEGPDGSVVTRQPTQGEQENQRKKAAHGTKTKKR